MSYCALEFKITDKFIHFFKCAHWYRTCSIKGTISNFTKEVCCHVLESQITQRFTLSGRAIEATDGSIGHVDDFIIDETTWAIRYLVIDTKNWWLGKKVLISPQWVDRVSWSESKVFVNLTREAIKESPEYTADTLLTRSYESDVHLHYSRQGYWVSENVNSAQIPKIVPRNQGSYQDIVHKHN